MKTSTLQLSSVDRIAVGALCLVQFVDVLGVAVVITALPAILAGLDAPTTATPLLVTGYAMFFGGLLLLGARLGDRFGHRRVLLVGLGLFGGASLLAALGWNVLIVTAARCLQGAAAALSVPAALRLLTAVAPEGSARDRALAVWSAAGAAAGASGFLLGGVLTDLAGWRAVFWINVPLAALLLLAVWRTAPRTPREAAGRLDVLGATLLTAAVMSLVLGSALLEAPDRRLGGVAFLGGGALLILAFRSAQQRASQPLLPQAALRNWRLRAGAGASFANTATTSSSMTLLTLHLQEDRGLSPTAAGLSLLPFSVGVVLGASVAPRVLDRSSPRTVAGLGLGVIAAGNAGLLLLPVAPWLLVATVSVAGVGIGLSSVAATAHGTDVPPALQGTAAGVLNTAAQLGTALGVAFLLLLAATAGAPLGYAAAAVAAAASGMWLVGRHRAGVERHDPVR
jgi:MFS family permease